MQSFFLFIFLICLPFLATSQFKSSFYKSLKNDGALLVRLSTKESQIAALRQKGKDKVADELAARQATINRNIINGFKENYTIGPVYFFFTEQTQAIRNKDFASVTFLDANLKPDTSIKFSGEKFLTAEFASIDQNEIKPTSKYDKAHGTQYHNGSVTTFEALILKDDQVVQLTDPYLVYVKTYESMFLRRTADNVIRKFNDKLKKRLPRLKKTRLATPKEAIKGSN